MYRHRLHVVVKYGQFRQHKELFDKLNAACEAKGWRKMQAWVPFTGDNNVFVIETDYPDLATFESEGLQFFGDAEVMKIWRQMADLVIEGTGRDELLTEAPNLA